MKFRRRSAVTEAHRWFPDKPDAQGAVVQRLNEDDRPCRECRSPLSEHGWLQTPAGGQDVCPGDWIISLGLGCHRRCEALVFEAVYEPIAEEVR